MFVYASTLKGHLGGITAIQVNNGKVVSSSGDLCVKVWSIDTGECLRTFSYPAFVASVHVDGQKLSKGAPHPIQIIDHLSGETIATLGKMKQIPWTAYAKLEDGRCVALVSGSLEGQVTIWGKGEDMMWSPLQHLRLYNNVVVQSGTSSHLKALNGVCSAGNGIIIDTKNNNNNNNGTVVERQKLRTKIDQTLSLGRQLTYPRLLVGEGLALLRWMV